MSSNRPLGEPIETPSANWPQELAGLVRGVATLVPALALTWRRLPRGEGATVMVAPGYGADDRSTLVLRHFLSLLGYRVHGWGLGRNHGDLRQLVPRFAERVEAVAARSGQTVALVGWSLGGVVAREAARRKPDRVRQVITLGTPVVGGPKYTATARAYAARGVDLDALEASVAERNRRPLPVPVTAIYSKRDTIVAWQACFDPNPSNPVEHVEVGATHVELGFSAAVLRLVAQTLARPIRSGSRHA